MRSANKKPGLDASEAMLRDHEDVIPNKEKMLDKTLADTFPASDPLSTLPDPSEDSFGAEEWDPLSVK